MRTLRQAIAQTFPDHHGMFHDAFEKAEAAHNSDLGDEIFLQARDKVESLWPSMDAKYPDNNWPVFELIDELIEWVTEDPRYRA